MLISVLRQATNEHLEPDSSLILQIDLPASWEEQRDHRSCHQDDNSGRTVVVGRRKRQS